MFKAIKSRKKTIKDGAIQLLTINGRHNQKKKMILIPMMT